MVFSFRRAVKFGPLRVNFSTSGLGVSAGVRGARVSVGPRGTYVNLEGGGFRYRRKVGGRDSAAADSPRVAAPSPVEASAGPIATAPVAELAHATPDAVLAEISSRLNRTDYFKAYAFLGTGLGAVAWLKYGAWSYAVLGVLVVLAPFVYLWNKKRRTARIVYDVDDQAVLDRLALCNAVGEALASCSRIWHVYSSTATADRKRNAGAGNLIERTATACAPGSLDQIELNIEAWAVRIGPQQLLFLPDRLLVLEGNRVAGLAYEDLAVHDEPTRFIEEDAVPPDGQVVDRTWRYVNKSGGPDRRFKDNRELPVLRYGKLLLASDSGVNVVLQTSTVEACERAAAAIAAVQRAASSPPTDHDAAVEPARLSQADRPSLPPVDSSTPDTPRPPSPIHGAPVPLAASELLHAAATVLRYIAAADRKISNEEVSHLAEELASLAVADGEAVRGVVDRFRGMKSSESAARAAMTALATHDKAVADRIFSSAETMAEADGKTTPKEKQRLGQLRTWAGL